MTELFVAVGAGLISFLSPCVLPLIPGYISYISGSTLNELLDKKRIDIFPIILFTVGFSIVFIAFGATATFIGSLILDNSYELRVAAGLIIIIFSLHIMGVINLKFLNYEKRINVEKNSGKFGPILIGMAFGFGWTPCIGPILGSILALASTEQSLNRGILLLFFYSLGLAIPFIISGYLIQKFMVFSKNLKQKMNLIVKIGGILLLVTGILILTNQLQAIGYYLIEYIPLLQNFG
jgi:cytochrome c-type biogenesis protein